MYQNGSLLCKFNFKRKRIHCSEIPTSLQKMRMKRSKNEKENREKWKGKEKLQPSKNEKKKRKRNDKENEKERKRERKERRKGCIEMGHYCANLILKEKGFVVPKFPPAFEKWKKEGKENPKVKKTKHGRKNIRNEENLKKLTCAIKSESDRKKRIKIWNFLKTKKSKNKWTEKNWKIKALRSTIPEVFHEKCWSKWDFNKVKNWFWFLTSRNGMKIPFDQTEPWKFNQTGAFPSKTKGGGCCLQEKRRW